MADKEERNGELLKLIVEDYLDSGKAIGSESLVETHGLSLSSASVRATMASLEEDGYLTHFYTSAGRVPTEQGIKYWLDHYFSEARLSPREKKMLEGTSFKTREDTKQSARALNELSDLAVIVLFDPHDVYYTGLSSLLRQPEFSHHDHVITISTIIDELDQRASKIYKDLGPDTPSILVGNDNPFGNLCGLVAKKFSRTNGLLIGILGPMRMDYRKHYALLETLSI